MDPRIRTAVVFMEENLSKRLRGRELARRAGLTPQHFCVLFKEQIGEPPMHYLSRLRIEKARALLESSEHSNLSIKEIAARVGCQDMSHFVRNFERMFGLSPRRYRLDRG